MMGYTGGHNGMDGNNVCPLDFDGERLLERWSVAFCGGNKCYHLYSKGEDPEMKNKQTEHFFVSYYHLFR